MNQDIAFWSFITKFIFDFHNLIHNWIWNNVLSRLELIEKTSTSHWRERKENKGSKNENKSIEDSVWICYYIITDVRDCIASEDTSYCYWWYLIVYLSWIKSILVVNLALLLLQSPQHKELCEPIHTFILSTRTRKA